MCLGGIFDYDGKKEKLEEVSRELEDSAVWNNPERAQALGKERSALEQIVGTIDKLDQGLEDVAGLVELAVEAEDEDTFVEAQQELAELEAQLAKLEFRRMFSGKNDSNNCYLDIQAGSGGTEAQDWASMLMRMYLRWGEAKGFSPELYEVTDGDVAGIKGWYVRARSTPATAATLHLRRCLCHQKSTMISKSKSTRPICASTPTVRLAPVVSTLTGRILRCVLLTCQPTSWCNVKTTARNIKTVTTPLNSCAPNCMSLNCKSKMPKNKHWKTPNPTSVGAVRSARMCWMTRASKTCAPALKHATPSRSLMATWINLSKPA